MLGKLVKKGRIIKRVIRLKSEVVSKKESSLRTHQGIQFSKERLVDFGELPVGQIPLELMSSPSSDLKVLQNQVRVISERYEGETVSVSLFLRGGSRYENLTNSGSARLLTNLFLRGTKKSNRQQVEKRIEELGNDLTVTCERELIGLSLNVLPEDVDKAVELLSELITETDVNDNQVEAEKMVVQQQSQEVGRDQNEQTIESVFYCAFRDHMMGIPKNGNRDNIQDLTGKALREYYQQVLSGENLVLAVSGAVEHKKVQNLAEKNLSAINQHGKSMDYLQQSLEKPLLTPSMMSQRDDEIPNVNVGVAFEAPGYNNPEFVSFLLYEEITGNYNAHEDGMAHVNTGDRQYNYLHRVFSERPGINLQRTKYYGFSDVGLFTSWVHGNEVWTLEMFNAFPYILGWQSKNINQAECFRARSKLFNKLLEQQNSPKLNFQLAQNALYLNRRLNRTELAYRFSSAADYNHIRAFGKKWFYDQDMALVLHGNVHLASGVDHYQDRIQASSRGDPTGLIV